MAEPDGGGLYGPDDVAGFDYERDLSRPGEYPYTRGIHADMYRGRLWTMRQYAGFGDARQTNSRFRYLLEKGQTGLSVAFDLPTQMGYDSDDRLSEGEVGRVGVAIDTVEDLDVLFAGIPLDTVSVSMTINATAGILVAMYAVLARRRGYDLSRLSGTLQNDILKEYVARGTYIFPPRPSLRLVTDTIGFCLRTLPRFNPISISGYHIREAGATAVQEVAFTFADAIAYVKACIEAGFQVDQFAPRLSFFFNAHNNLLEEVAKFRAARRLWGRIMREEFRAGDPRSWMLRFHTQTAGSMLTAQQPENNIVRVALQALAAVLGGTQSLHTNSFDEALGLPTERSVEIALRTQQLLAHESGLTEVVDPLGGAYAIETLTNGIEQKAREYLRRIDELGGAVPAIEKGYFQQEISDSAFRYQREVETAERVVVGVNRFQGGDETPRDILRVDSRVREEQVQRLTTYRRGRDEETLARALLSLEKGARGEEPLVPLMIDCVEARATLGEISGVLRRVFGEYK
jgi:methylmalonyl-CoA mutase N-terminal domain/subunit